jgi:methyl coenzyme M reductase subunit D
MGDVKLYEAIFSNYDNKYETRVKTYTDKYCELELKEVEKYLKNKDTFNEEQNIKNDINDLHKQILSLLTEKAKLEMQLDFIKKAKRN